MKKLIDIKRFSLLPALLLCLLAGTACAEKQAPSFKVDFNMPEGKEREVQEPDFLSWKIEKGAHHSEMTIDGIKCSLSTEGGNLHTWFNKTYIRDAEKAAQNGRLTFDGVTLNGNHYGAFTLCFEGLPVGKHRLQTYHNCWENQASTYTAPFSVRCNGEVLHENVSCSFGEDVAANACIVTTEFEVTKKGELICIEFATNPEHPGKADNAGAEAAKMQEMKAPLCNGFELNTPEVKKQAKQPYPFNHDTHADADDKSICLQWKAAGTNVAEQRLYFAQAPADFDKMKPVAVLKANECSYTVDGLYSMNTYCWRVDEVDNKGNVTEGRVWTFKPRQLAFPGAEGYGRFAQGGRGGQVYHVTNLSNKREPGSFIYGLLDVQGPRTIVFDVSGIIDMEFKPIFVQPYITIAGQTAPGKGICLKHSNINIGSDDICRFMRAKRGYGITGNAMGMAGANHGIVDHCTAVWGTDETVSGRGAKNITFQYCIIAEALGIADHGGYARNKNHGYAATIDGKIGSWHHNLLANCYGRNFSMGGGMDGNNKAIGQMDLFNNVVYNWTIRTTDGNCHEVNFVANYYKMGTDTRRTELFTQQYENKGHRESTWRAFVSDNVRENKDGSLTFDKQGETYTVQLSNGDPGPKYETIVDKPFFPSYATIHSAEEAFKIVTSDAGATMPIRDEQHQRLIRETLEGTYTYVGSRSGIKGQIDHENDCGGFEEYPEEHRPADFDSDQDGLPDWYEKLIGSHPRRADQNADPDGDGWTLLEDYLEFMAHPYLLLRPNEEGAFDADICFQGFTNRNIYSIESACICGADCRCGTTCDGGSACGTENTVCSSTSGTCNAACVSKAGAAFSNSLANEIFSANIEGSEIRIQAGTQPGLSRLIMRVTDTEDGSSFEQSLGIAVLE